MTKESYNTAHDHASELETKFREELGHLVTADNLLDLVESFLIEHEQDSPKSLKQYENKAERKPTASLCMSASASASSHVAGTIRTRNELAEEGTKRVSEITKGDRVRMLRDVEMPDGSVIEKHSLGEVLDVWVDAPLITVHVPVRFPDTDERSEADLEVSPTDVELLTSFEHKAMASEGVWYHGSPKKFESFRVETRPHTSMGATEVPVFITRNEAFAREHAGANGYLYSVQLRVGRVFDSEDLMRPDARYWPPAENELTPLGQHAYAALANGQIWPDVEEGDANDWANFHDSRGLWAEILRGSWDVMESNEMMSWLQREGYEAFRVNGEDTTSLAVFDPAALTILDVRPIGAPAHNFSILPTSF